LWNYKYGGSGTLNISYNSDFFGENDNDDDDEEEEEEEEEEEGEKG